MICSLTCLNTYDRLRTDMLNCALSTQNTKLLVFWKNAAPCLCAVGFFFFSFVSLSDSATGTEDEVYQYFL